MPWWSTQGDWFGGAGKILTPFFIDVSAGNVLLINLIAFRIFIIASSLTVLCHVLVHRGRGMIG